MSLATTGGGGGLGGAGGAGGLTMGHDASGGAMANLAQNAAPPPMADGANATGTATSGASGVAVEVFDKTQHTSLSQVKQTAHLPVTAIDLYASTAPMVAYFPPKQSSQQSQSTATPEPVFLGKMKHKIGLMQSDAAHKTLRKYLTQAKPYAALKQDALVAKLGDNDKDVVVLDRPHLLLGQRRTSLLPKPLQEQFTIDTQGSHSAIAEEGGAEGGKSCWWTDSTLDGSTPHATVIDYDMDRVVAKVRLSSNKKALTLLPEEACSLVLHQARTHVASKYPKLSKDELTHFPVALAVPSWALNDATIEALYEAAHFCDAPANDASASSEPSPVTVFPRSLCSVFGSFGKPEGGPERNPFLRRIAVVQQALLKRHKMTTASPKDRFVAATLVLTMGSTADEGVECTAILCSYPQNNVPWVFYEEFEIVANVSQRLTKAQQAPASLLAECVSQMQTVLEQVAPDLDGPAVVLTYGTTHEQEALNAALKAHIQETKKGGAGNKEEEEHWLERVPIVAASVEAVPTGAALLGGLALGRVTRPDDPKSLPVKLQNTAAVATGIVHFYHPSQAKKLNRTPPTDDQVKVIFDFDRRLPAGPYSMDYKASECVVHQQRIKEGKEDLTTLAQSNHSSDNEEDEKAFLKAVKDAESRKNIPLREKAALDFTVQVFQKHTRNGPWRAVGNPMAPLVKLDTQIDPDTDEDKDETKIACEQVTMELNMTVTGTLGTAWAGERESVVQAVKSARGRLLEWWGWTLFAVSLFGGFFVKSWWEDYVWKRDTQRLLDYYKNVIPGSMQDGDYDTASWLAYKYRNKKDKLWQNLEEKYGVPVPEDFVWPETNETVASKKDEGDEVEDLDAEEKAEESATTETEAQEGGEEEAATEDTGGEAEEAKDDATEAETAEEEATAPETEEEQEDDGPTSDQEEVEPSEEEDEAEEEEAGPDSSEDVPEEGDTKLGEGDEAEETPEDEDTGSSAPDL